MAYGLREASHFCLCMQGVMSRVYVNIETEELFYQKHTGLEGQQWSLKGVCMAQTTECVVEMMTLKAHIVIGQG